MPANRSEEHPMMARDADSKGGAVGYVSSLSAEAQGAEAERRRQILAILDQGDRDITAGNGRDWAEVKQRMRERIAARTR